MNKNYFNRQAPEKLDNHYDRTEQIVTIAAIVAFVYLTSTHAGFGYYANMLLAYFICHSVFLIKINQFQTINIVAEVPILAPEITEQLDKNYDTVKDLLTNIPIKEKHYLRPIDKESRFIRARLTLNIKHSPLTGTCYQLPNLFGCNSFSVAHSNYDAIDKKWSVYVVPAPELLDYFSLPESVDDFSEEVENALCGGWSIDFLPARSQIFSVIEASSATKKAS